MPKVWRCYIVWGKRWYVTILPIFMLLSTAGEHIVYADSIQPFDADMLPLVAGFGTTYVFSQVKPGEKVFIHQLYPWITTYFSLTLATTVICTCTLNLFPVSPAANPRADSTCRRQNLADPESFETCQSAV